MKKYNFLVAGDNYLKTQTFQIVWILLSSFTLYNVYVYIYTLGFKGASRPSSISWTFSLCMHRETKTNKVRGFNKNNFVDFQNLMKIEFCWKLIFEILILHKPTMGSCEVSHNIWARLVQPFWCLLHTNKQTSKVYIYVYNVY